MVLPHRFRKLIQFSKTFMFNIKPNSIIYFVKIGFQLGSLIKAQNWILFTKIGIASTVVPRKFSILCRWKAKTIIYNFYVYP